MKYARYHEILKLFRMVREWISFFKRDFSSPYPTFIKMKTLTRFSIPRVNWVETGTYMGNTCRYLAKRYPRVISIEPSPAFFEYSKTRLKKFKNVTLLNGTSEELFLSAFVVSGPSVNVWLDGHFSDGGTFEGAQVTPVMDELEVVATNKHSFDQITLFIDDVRLFQKSIYDDFTGYPTLMSIVNWCNENRFKWQIQNDILIAQMVK